jgi:hypothetical protein
MRANRRRSQWLLQEKAMIEPGENLPCARNRTSSEGSTHQPHRSLQVLQKPLSSRCEIIRSCRCCVFHKRRKTICSPPNRALQAFYQGDPHTTKLLRNEATMVQLMPFAGSPLRPAAPGRFTWHCQQAAAGACLPQKDQPGAHQDRVTLRGWSVGRMRVTSGCAAKA